MRFAVIGGLSRLARGASLHGARLACPRCDFSVVPPVTLTHSELHLHTVSVEAMALCIPTCPQVHFPEGLAREGRSAEDNVVTLTCRRFLFDPAAKKVLRQ